MFKLIFRIIVITMFVVFVSLGLAMWKGGEPFRDLGEGLTVIGRSIASFGDFVDEFIAEGKQLGKSYKKFKDIADTDETAGKDK